MQNKIRHGYKENKPSKRQSGGRVKPMSAPIGRNRIKRQGK